MKTYNLCKVCKIPKRISEFKTYNGKCRQHCICNRCTKLISFRPHAIIHRIWYSQLIGSKVRGFSIPDYTEEWLVNWLLTQDLYYELHNKWAINGYNTYLKPSIDRIDDNIGYMKDNIQLMTWEENSDKGNRTGRHIVNIDKNEDFI